MNIKKQIRTALQNTDFPDLHFLYSSEVLEIAEEVLEDLLSEEKQDFEKKLKTGDEDITFETFEDFSSLDYFFSLLEHYQGVNNDEKIRKIIENFEPKYIDFGNEIAYSKRYYEMLKYCYEQILQPLSFSIKGENLSVDYEKVKQQKRILEKSIESYEVRGIALPEDKQKRLKSISKELSELSQKFSNNVLDSQKLFEYIITDEEKITEMPEDDKQVAKGKYEEKMQISSLEKRGDSEVSFSLDNVQAVQDADIVIYSVPIAYTQNIIEETLPYIKA